MILAGRSLRRSIAFVSALSMLILTTGCNSTPKELAQAQTERQGDTETDGAIPVDVAIARTGTLQEQLEYTGRTLPLRIVSLRSQVEGKLLDLKVDVGDSIKQGQIIGTLDDALLLAALNQASAQLAALRSEVARATTQVNNARVEVERARLELVQAQADAQRQQKLLKEGAIALQTAEQSRTQASTATQVLRAAQQQVNTEQEVVAAAEGRLVAQNAVVAQARERRSYAQLQSPITGVVTERVTEPGNLLQPGGEVLKIADFSRVKVVVQVSELELAEIQQGQSVQVRLDAFPNQQYIGRLTRISPAVNSNSTAALIPVEVVIPNTNGRIGSGLLARVNFNTTAQPRVVVQQTALQGERETAGEKTRQKNGTVFVVTQANSKNTVTARAVTLGETADGKVEILSGLKAGESYVARSGKPLKEGDAVRLSIISENQPGEK